MTGMTQESGQFTAQLMQDASFLRKFIAVRGLYSKEILNANKSLVISIEKAQREIEGGTLTADSENAVLSSMGDVLQHLKCTRIDDLRRADTQRFKVALWAGRIIVFAVMLLSIAIALPLTLAFNQLTAVDRDIEAALGDEKVELFVQNEIESMKTKRQLKLIQEAMTSGGTSPQQTAVNLGKDNLGKDLDLSAETDLTAKWALLEYEISSQEAAWLMLTTPPAVLVPLFSMSTSWGWGDAPVASPARRLASRLSGDYSSWAHSTGDQVAIIKEEILPIKRQIEAWTYLLNNGVLPLLYGMLGAAVFLSRQYMSPGTELWALNPLANAFMRIGLGGIAGLIVGWFQTPDGVRELTTTPFAIAFFAGFSIDIVFSLLERIVAAFDFRKAAT